MSQNQGKDDNGFDFESVFVLSIMLLVGAWFAYIYLMPYYYWFWVTSKYYLFKGLEFVSLLKIDSKPVMLNLLFFWVAEPLKLVQYALNNLEPMMIHDDFESRYKSILVDTEDMVVKDIYHNINYLGAYLFRYYVWVLSLFVCFKVITKPQFKRVFSINRSDIKKYNRVDFVKEMAKQYPELLCAAYDNPLDYSLHDGHWAVAPTPIAHLKENKVLYYADEKGEKVLKINQVEFAQYLKNTLGDPWSGVSSCNQYYKFLISAMLPLLSSPNKGHQKTSYLLDLLGYAHSSKPGIRSRFSKYRSMRKAKKYSDSLLKEYSQDPVFEKVQSSHYYMNTVVLKLMSIALDTGRFHTSKFTWLKVFNRELYYVLDNTGREVGYVHILGAWSHYLTEISYGLPKPFISTATSLRGLDEYLYKSVPDYRPVLQSTKEADF
ncbi:secretion/conjugation apparatus DotM-related subunit [Photobacterium leiognathi]|uniref:secretion/conjugation apparatus DotM-related subunit n=1 Tax=Photobacterium leiognathi TaxID=553611 RepID=UPI0029826CD1|nr:hypothetical protein [Photobacterium leiognathi]